MYICINNDINLTHPDNLGKTRLTKDKVYIGEEYYTGIETINDDGQKETFAHERFIKLREHNLEKLGI